MSLTLLLGNRQATKGVRDIWFYGNFADAKTGPVKVMTDNPRTSSVFQHKQSHKQSSLTPFGVRRVLGQRHNDYKLKISSKKY